MQFQTLDFRDEDGQFMYSAANRAVRKAGGVAVASSNDGQRDVSFAPSIDYAMPDGSIVVVTYSGFR